MSGPSANAASWTTSRVSGTNRFDTAVQVSKQFFPSTAPVVVLANGTKFADSLSGSALAAKLDGPLLLVQQNSLPAEVATELGRLKPAKVLVLGGAAAIADTVISQVNAAVSTTVTRLAGATRYETSAAIVAHGWPNGAPTVYVATGEGYPAGLLAGAAAGREGSPVLLTTSASVPAAITNELKRLAPTEVRAVTYGTSGPGYLASAALDQIRGATNAQYSAISGGDLYDISMSLASITGQPTPRALLTTSEAFPDALAAGAAAAAANQTLLMTGRDCMPEKINTFITSNRISALTVIGGTAAITNPSAEGTICLSGVQAGQDWETAALPKSVSKAAIDSKVDVAFGAANDVNRVRSVVITIGDKIVYERYHPLDSASTVMTTNSVSKSVTSTIVGMLVADGKLNVDQKAPVAAWSSASDPRNKITLKNLLQMQSGLAFEDRFQVANNNILPLLSAPNASEYASAQPLEFTPGTKLDYTSANTAILMGIVTDTLGGPAATDAYIKSRLVDPIGLRSATFEKDKAGRIKGFIGINMTSRDLARFGLLYLRNGMWGRNRIISTDWMNFSWTRSSTTTSELGYYYQGHWWEYKNDHVAIGFGGQWLVVAPSKNMVMVITTASIFDNAPGSGQAVRSFTLKDELYALFPDVT